MAFILTIFLVKDPALIFERSLVKIEQDTYSAYKGLAVALRATSNVCSINIITGDSIRGFLLRFITFFAAVRILFTPLPIFLSRELVLQESMVYALSINSAGGVIGYFSTGKNR
ncbi:MAG: hypothetical protein QXK66_02140 [Sulfolobales archaeon]